MVTSDLEEELETIEETEEEATLAPTEVQLIQQELEKETKRHDDTVAYFSQRIASCSAIDRVLHADPSLLASYTVCIAR